MGLFRKKISIIILPLILIISCIIGMAFYQGYAVSNVQKNAFSELDKSESEQIRTINSIFNGQVDLLKAFADSANDQKLFETNDLYLRMNSVVKSSLLSHLWICNLDGEGRSDDNQTLNFSDRNYYVKAKNGEIVIEKVDIGHLDGEPKYIIAVPIQKNKEILGVLLASYEQQDFRKLIVPESYYEENSAIICDKQGKIIIATQNSSLAKISNNIFESINNAEFKDNYSFDMLHNDIINESSGISAFSVGGKKMYAVYKKIGINDWIMFNILPGEAVDINISQAIRSGFYLLFFVVLVCIFIVCYITILANKQIQFVRREENYERQLEIYRKNTSSGVFALNIDRDFTLIYANDNFYAIHEYTPSEMRNKLHNKCFEYVVKDDAPKIKSIVFNAISDKKKYVTFSMRVNTGSGKLKYILVIANIEKQNDEYVLCGTEQDITEQKMTELMLNNEKKALFVSEERFRIALEQTTVSIWEYDLDSKSIIQSGKSIEVHGFGNIIKNVPESLIENGYVYPESADEFREMYNKLFRGIDNVNGTFKVKSANRKGYWYERIKYTLVFDDNGHAYKAIGVSNDVTEKMEVLHKYKIECDLRHHSGINTIATFVINLSKNEIDSFDTTYDNLSDIMKNATPDEIFKKLAISVVDSECHRREIMSLGTDILLDAHKNRNDDFSFEFLGELDDCEKIWHRLTIHTIESPQTGDILAFTYLININDEKLEREKLEKKAELDSLTGLLNQATAKQKINNYLNYADENSISAFILIHINNYRVAVDTLGHFEGDRVVIRVADEIKKHFSDDDILAYMGNGEIIAFVKNSSSKIYYRRKSEELFDALQFSISKESIPYTIDISVSIGIDICEGANKSFDILCGECEIGIYEATKSGKKIVSINIDDENNGMDSQLFEKAKEIVEKESDNTVQLTALLKYMDGGVLLIEVGEALKSIYISPSFYSFSGRKRITNMTESEYLFSLVYEADKEDLVNSIYKCVNSNETIDITYRVTINDGDIEWRHMRAVQIPYQASKHPVVIAVITDITKQKKLELQLLEDKQKLSIAFEQTDLRMWEYNRETKEIHISGGSTVFVNMPENHINKGYIHIDSVKAYRDFYERMRGNDESGYVIIRTRHLGERFMWYRMTFKNLFDKDGIWIKTVGVTESLAHIDAEKNKFDFEEKMFHVIEQNVVWIAKANISKNTIEVSINKNNNRFHFNNETILTEYLKSCSQYVTDEGDKFVLLSKFSPDSLIEAFDSGNVWNSFEYRRKTSDNRIEWVSLNAHLLRDPVNNELYCYAYMLCIDLRKGWELSINKRVRREPISYLYDFETFKEISNHVISSYKNESSRMCCMIQMNIGGAELVSKNRYSDTIIYIARLVRIFFEESSIVGINNNIVLIFIPNAISAQNVRKSVSNIIMSISNLRCDAGINEKITFIFAGAVTRINKSSFDLLDRLCVRSKSQCVLENESFCCYNIIEDTALDSDTYGDLFVKSIRQNSNDGLNSIEQEYLIKCMYSFITSTSSIALMNEVLKMLGEYYNSKRVFVLSISADLRFINLIGEWDNKNVKPRAKSLSNVTISHFAPAKLALESKDVLVLTNDNKKFIILPMLKGAKIKRILCIDTPQKNIDRTLLLSKVSDLWIKSLYNSRNNSINTTDEYIDTLTGLYNRNKYSEYVFAFDDNSLSSLGVAYLDINQLSQTNATLGNEYGDNSVKYAADIITNSFGRENIFKISGDEFIIFAKNLVYESFSEKCRNIKERFSKLYPNGISIGYTWSDKDIYIKTMVSNAEELMKTDKQNYYEELRDSGKASYPEQLQKLLNDIKTGLYEVYLQPKVRASDLKIIGAEALLKYKDKKHGIISPSKFVSLYEKMNMIKYLDLFVCKQSLRAMKKWRDMGVNNVHIAVNFSRQTFLDPDSLNSLLEFSRKYEIPANEIEIEITETIGNIGKNYLFTTYEKYRKSGFLLTLDDFGSEYSSLSIVSEIHFDVIKIDKSLINSIVTNNMSKTIVETIISCSAKMGVNTVAEGIETKEQLEALRKLKCDIIQGFYIDKPLDMEAFENKYIHNGK